MSPLRTLLIVILFAFGFMLTGCDKMPGEQAKPEATKEEMKVVAIVNGENILDSDYQGYLQLRQQQVGPIPDKEKEKQIVLDELIDKMLLAQYAINNNLDKDPEVNTLLKRIREEILGQAAKRKQLRDHPITEADVKARFEQEVEKTHKTEYKVRHILLKEESEAKEVIAQLAKGTKFEKLAKSKSIDKQSGNTGGEIGWVNQGMVVPDFFTAVTEMKKGAVSATPVKTDFGWHVIKLEDTRPLKVPTFEDFISDKQARTNIYRKMQNDRIDDLTRDLRSKAKITVN